jgi:hypothetical protein
MPRQPARSAEGGAPQQDDVAAKNRLDEWLDDALACTFPASDPIASPPSGTLRDGGNDCG